jgi:hypothetical protein
MIIAPKLIHPWAHRVFVDDKPYYIDCTLDTCKMCHRIEVAKAIIVLQRIIKKRVEEDQPKTK